MTATASRAALILERLERPIVELRYLLSRGYRRSHAIRFVGDHHQLDASDRNVLERVVFSSEDAEKREERLVDAGHVRGATIAVDGYNVFIGLECLLDGAPLFLCDDGVVRDIAGRRGLRRKGGAAREVVSLLCERLRSLGVSRVIFIFDEQVSRSGELAATVRAEIDRLALPGEARTEPQADRALIEMSGDAVIATSDRVIIDAAPRVFDAVRNLAEGRIELARLT